MPGVSSMKTFASLSVPSACDSRPQSLSTRKPGAQAMAVDARLGREHAEKQLLLRHFEAEDADRASGLRADVLRDVQHERRLPHRRPRRDDDEIARLKSGRQLVEIGEPRRHAGDELLALVRPLDRREARVRELAHRHESGAHAILGNREDRLLGLVENQIGLLLRLVGGRQNLVGREDEVAQRRLLADDARVVLDVGGVGQAVDERGDIGRAADFVELSRARELFLERDEVDRVSPLAQLDHLLEDPAMRVAVEIARVENLGGLVERVVVDEDGAEDGSLRFEVMRQRTIDCDRFGHRSALSSSALSSRLRLSASAPGLSTPPARLRASLQPRPESAAGR